MLNCFLKDRAVHLADAESILDLNFVLLPITSFVKLPLSDEHEDPHGAQNDDDQDAWTTFLELRGLIPPELEAFLHQKFAQVADSVEPDETSCIGMFVELDLEDVQRGEDVIAAGLYLLACVKRGMLEKLRERMRERGTVFLDKRHPAFAFA